MSDCLIDYVGIRLKLGQEAPESGLWINTLPGISLASIDSIANDDQVTYRQVWDDIQQEASTEFDVDFFNALLSCYQINLKCDYKTLICDNLSVLAVAWKYCLGTHVMNARIYSDRLNYFTNITVEEAKELMSNYQVQYEAALEKAVKLIDTSSCDLDCGGNPEVVTWLP